MSPKVLISAGACEVVAEIKMKMATEGKAQGRGQLYEAKRDL